MTRRRKGNEVLGEINLKLGQIAKQLPILEERVAVATEDAPDLQLLVISLDTFKLWIKRQKVLEVADLPNARLRFNALVDVLLLQLGSPQARRYLGGQLRAGLAALGKDLLQLTRLRP